MKRVDTFVFFSVLLSVLALSLSTFADGIVPQFKVGDRVEVDIYFRHDPKDIVWEKGTVKEVLPDKKLYVIDIDSGYTSRVGMSTPEKWIRAAPTTTAQKPKAPAAKTPPAKTAQAPKAKTAAATDVPMSPVKGEGCPVAQSNVSRNPNPVLLKKLIRCLYEKTSEIETVRIGISQFKLGQPRAWRLRDDIGNGNAKTRVYPARVSYRWTTYYARHIDVSDNIAVFNCYYNTFGEWECTLAQRVKDGERRSIPRQR